MDALTKELLFHALEQSANGIIILNREEAVLLWNEQMVRYTGISAAEATGRKLINIFPAISGNRVHTSIQACLSQGVPAFLSQT
ncbi:MAG: PAS domain-containing protein, partial [Candidatus Electrothrix sp. AUS4]|nr:PAS domain-containing protein [Candidatus Electrothrix sp. AUS4]